MTVRDLKLRLKEGECLVMRDFSTDTVTEYGKRNGRIYIIFLRVPV